MPNLSNCHTSPVSTDYLTQWCWFYNPLENMERCFIASDLVFAEHVTNCCLSKATDIVRIVCEISEERPRLIVIARTFATIHKNLVGASNNSSNIHLCRAFPESIFLSCWSTPRRCHICIS